MNICINLVVCVCFCFCLLGFFYEDYFSLASRGQSIRRDIPGQQTAKFLPRLHLNPLGQLCHSLQRYRQVGMGFQNDMDCFLQIKMIKSQKLFQRDNNICSVIHFRLMYMYFQLYELILIMNSEKKSNSKITFNIFFCTGKGRKTLAFYNSFTEPERNFKIQKM